MAVKAIKIKRTRGEPREGTLLLRAPDGSITKVIHFYTDDPPLGERKKMTPAEEDVCEGIIRDMSVWFHNYIEAAQKAE